MTRQASRAPDNIGIVGQKERNLSYDPPKMLFLGASPCVGKQQDCSIAGKVFCTSITHTFTRMHFHLVKMFYLVCSWINFVSGIFPRQKTNDYTLGRIMALSRNVRGPRFLF